MESLENRNKLYSQIEEQYGKVVYSYTCQLKMAKRLQKYNRRWKWAQIIIAAFSTTSFISLLFYDTRIITVIAGFLSLVLLVINSYLKDIDQNGDSKEHLRTAQSLWLIREKYISLLTDFDSLSLEKIVSLRDQLISDTDNIYKYQIDTDDKAYREAAIALKNNQEQFFSREELDKMLPEQLRKGD